MAAAEASERPGAAAGPGRGLRTERTGAQHGRRHLGTPLCRHGACAAPPTPARRWAGTRARRRCPAGARFAHARRQRRRMRTAAAGVTSDPRARGAPVGGGGAMAEPRPSAGSEELTESEESEESAYSGLEDSGSDSTGSEEEEEEEEREEGPGGGSLPRTPAEGAPRKSKTLEDDSSLEENKALPAQNEYEEDSSDEEDIRNTVGNIPMEWYQDFPHIGYDLEGRRIYKPLRSKDELDLFLEKMENPDYWRTVQDRRTGADLKLSDEEVALVQRLQKGHFGDVHFDPYEPAVDFFTHEVMLHPVTNRPADKRSFIPSLIEKEKVSKLVHAIKMGWIKPRKPKDETPTYYDLWAHEDPNSILGRHKMHVPAPKMKLPGHEESYNPPPEYLLSEEERLAWEQQEPAERRLSLVPQRHRSLRAVPAFPRFIHERFERCLDLYLCPRQRRMRVNVDPEDLIPKLPKPRDLQPFPTTQALVYRGHTSLVRCLSISPSGQWLVSGSDDGSVRFWEVSTARCVWALSVGAVVKSLAWNPNPSICLVAIAVEQSVLLVNPCLGDKLLYGATDQVLASFVPPEEERLQPVQWVTASAEEQSRGIRLLVQHTKAVKQLTWHGKGDYFASVVEDNGGMQVLIHQSSKRWSQSPFRRGKGLVQCVLFHPVRPYFFVATQRYVRVYNLLKQELTKKLMSNCKWVSSMAIHPGGDNIICGSYDSKLAWFDLDLSTRPYQLLRHHKRALRSVAFHKRYPLFASASDDGTVIVCHGMVYNDLLQNPLLVPVKVLKGHVPTLDLGVLDVLFHPTQPWVFSSGADGTIRLYT
ncbi:ribosome biogenesis protein BOP1 [Pezoporus occidentalis]|uniref:ribosome biogenesis protein BOP1 n=1 Tax=Pezoporus occidentalis TaxID=407982 RepID=UPI002F917E23